MREAREVFRCAGIVWGALALLALTAPHVSAQEDSTSTSSLVPIAVRPEPGPEFVADCTEYVLKYGGGAGTQGTYGPLDMPSCADDLCGSAGYTRYRCLWLNGYPCRVDSGTCVPMQVGNMAGSTVQGITSRFAADTDQRQGICYDQYSGNGQRILVTPITSALDAPGCAGYMVLRYGQFFLTRLPGAGNSEILYVNFLGYSGAIPTPTRASTWGKIKELYR